MMQRFAPIIAALALAGCGPLVQLGGNAPAPDALLVLRADAPPPHWAGPTAVGDTLAVAIPDVPAELQTLRLPVQLTSATVQYLAGASWAEQPNRQFQRLLADTLPVPAWRCWTHGKAVSPRRGRSPAICANSAWMCAAPQWCACVMTRNWPGHVGPAPWHCAASWPKKRWRASSLRWSPPPSTAPPTGWPAKWRPG